MSELEIEVKHIAEALLKKEVFVDYSGAVCAVFVMLMARKVGRVDVELKDVVKVLCEGGVPAELALHFPPRRLMRLSSTQHTKVKPRDGLEFPLRLR